jgi:hypothetical protein
VKNLFELKAGRRILADGNIFENLWPDAQNGYALLWFATGPSWGTVQDVTFTNNIVRHASNGLEICGDKCSQTTATTQVQNFLVANNLFEDIGTSKWLPGGGSRLFLIINNVANVTLQHNTALEEGTLLFGDGAANRGFVFANNLVKQASLGVVGSGTAIGTATLNRYFPSAVFKGNVIIGGGSFTYPAGNYFPVDIASVLLSLLGSDYSLLSSSPYAGRATDGADIGVDWDALKAATGTVVSGRP